MARKNRDQEQKEGTLSTAFAPRVRKDREVAAVTPLTPRPNAAPALLEYPSTEVSFH